jgi:hypothetical protein
MKIAPWKKRHRANAHENPPSLVLVRRRARELIALANQSDSSAADCDTTSSRDLEAVRALRRAQREVHQSIQLASAAGVDDDSIRSEGIDYAVSSTILMNELAHFMIGEIKASIRG